MYVPWKAKIKEKLCGFLKISPGVVDLNQILSMSNLTFWL